MREAHVSYIDDEGMGEAYVSVVTERTPISYLCDLENSNRVNVVSETPTALRSPDTVLEKRSALVNYKNIIVALRNQ